MTPLRLLAALLVLPVIIGVPFQLGVHDGRRAQDAHVARLWAQIGVLEKRRAACEARQDSPAPSGAPVGPPRANPPTIDCFPAGAASCCFVRGGAFLDTMTWTPIGCVPNPRS